MFVLVPAESADWPANAITNCRLRDDGWRRSLADLRDPDLSPAVIRQDRVGKPGHGAYSQTPIPGRSAGLDRKPVLPRPARALSPPCSGLLVATGPSPQPPARRNRGRAEPPN